MFRKLIFILVVLSFGCGSSGQQNEDGGKEQIDQGVLKESLDQLEGELKSNKTTKIDKAKANALIDQSIQYVDAFPGNKLSPGFLFRAAEVCVGIGSYEKAIKYWERLKTDYEDYEKTPIALFLQGFTCENQMKDKACAKKYYNDFLEQYPSHEYVDQVQLLLKNIDLSAEELIKSFQQKK